MCGLAGVVAGDRTMAEEAVRRMNGAQRHRGPDDEGLVSLPLPHGHLVLGHRRLAILDLSPAGHQPMTNADTGDWLVYNGEIYNFAELRRELEHDGVCFRSRCDTEVILKAYATWGTDCVGRLHGMFALALFDVRARRLLLARDPLGIKPLYLARAAGVLAFASEMQALLGCGLLDGEIDPRGVAGLLAYGAVPEPLTLLRQVRLVEPGTWQTVDLDGLTPWRTTAAIRRYWDFPVPAAAAMTPERTEQMHARLAAAVRAHLVSDVPVGLFLSGGLDSCSIAALARQHGAELDAFTVTLVDHPDASEGAPAAAVARSLGMRFHEVPLTDAEILSRAAAFLDCVDQPTVDGLNTFIVSRAVRERGVVVALSGLGGDEIFGGYSSFREVPRLLRWSRWGRWVPKAWRRWGAGWVYRRAAPVRRFKAKEMAGKGRDLRSFYLRRRRLLSDAEMEALGFVPEKFGLDEDYLTAETDLARGCPAGDPEAGVSILESRFYMANTLLRDADVFGMANGLEIRVPLLDRRVVDYGCALAGSVRVSREGPNKRILVEALGRHLPAGLRGQPKRGFALPQSAWLAGPLRDLFGHLLGVVKASGLVELKGVEAVWRDFLDDRRGPTWSRVWVLGILGSWLERAARRTVP